MDDNFMEMELVSLPTDFANSLPIIASPETSAAIAAVNETGILNNTSLPSKVSVSASIDTANFQTEAIAQNSTLNSSATTTGDSPSSTASSLASNPSLLYKTSPAYPKSARRLNHQGTVIVRIQIATDGSVGSTEIKQSSGYDALDSAALEAVKNWQFKPASDSNGNPVSCYTTVPIAFRLN